jgi:haloalkane dehalogenase
MSFVDTGEGDPIVFLHGNPTWSYLWRNIIPHVIPYGRCLAPDLIGMGQSSPAVWANYGFVSQAAYLDAWFDSLCLSRRIVLVVHDWGSALGFYRALRFPEQIRAIVHMEAIATPRIWSDFGPSEPLFRKLRSEAGAGLVFDHNIFVEEVLPRGILRELTPAEMTHYRAPFLDRHARLPTLVWPRQIPVDGEPAEMTVIVERYSAWIATSAIPKLLILGDPGAIVAGRTREFCETWQNQEQVAVRGRHFLQEDSPHEIGVAIATFLGELDA